MNQEVKKMWLEALRSGDYKQGFQYMKNDNNEYCCLGVLTCLYNKEHNNKFSWEDLTTFMNTVHQTTVNKIPSNIVYDWAGLKKNACGGNNPTIVVNNINEKLSVLNDDGHTFEEIADLIEQQF